VGRPEVVALAGISPDELERFRKPAPFASQGGAVRQPPVDRTKPQMRGFPEGVLEQIYALSDDEVAERMSVTDPPVRY
jgi:hypothetical protein